MVSSEGRLYKEFILDIILSDIISEEKFKLKEKDFRKQGSWRSLTKLIKVECAIYGH